MAKTGQTQSTTTKDKDFAGTGVEGQKGQDAKQETPTPPADPDADGSTPPADPDADGSTPPADPPGAETVTAPFAEAQPASEIVRGEDVIKRLRDKGHRV